MLFIFSCTREYSTEANNRIEDNTNAWVGKVNFQEMENFIQKNTKKQIPNYLKLHNLGKRTEQYITDIDTTDIIKVVHDSITSFTIKVNTLSDKDFTFSNLVINVKNNKIEEYIYHYKPEAQWLRAYIAGEENNYEGVLKITDIDGNDTRKTYSRQASTPTTCMVYIHVPCYGSGCPCTDYNGVTYYMAATCGGGGGGNSGDYPSGELSGGGGGTVPSVPTSEQINSFIAFLSPSIHAYITQNTNTLTDINNYFIQNGLSPKHQSFITSILEYVERKDIAWFTFSSTFNSAVAYKKQYPDNWIKISTIQDFAFDFMLQNPNTSWEQFQNWFMNADGTSRITFDSSVNANNSFVFDNYAELNNFLNNNFKTYSYSSEVMSNDGAQKITRLRVNRMGIYNTGINIEIKLKKQNNLWTFDSLHSEEYIGVGFLYEWAQSTFTNSNNTNPLKIEIFGYEKFGFSISGINIKYKNYAKVNIFVNPNTGEIISASWEDLPG